MQRFSRWDRLRYAFDNTLSRGTIALIAWLFLLSSLFIVVFALFLVFTGIGPGEGGGRLSLASAAWIALMRTMDSGAVAGDEGSRAFLATMFVVTLGGIFIVSILIGLITSGIESRIESLRKGRSRVCETGHTLLLGWSPQIFAVLSELVLANRSRKRATLVILADRDKVEMEAELRERLGDTGQVRIVCRSGAPIDPSDLAIVNPADASSVIILPPDAPNPDTHVIKAILALVRFADRGKIPFHIVSQLLDPKNLEVAKAIAPGRVHLVLVEQFIASITVQASRQSGLSAVYADLLDFEGDEIYLCSGAILQGKTFQEALLASETTSIIGIRRAEGTLLLAPAPTTRIEAGDQLVVVAEDDSSIVFAPRAELPVDLTAMVRPAPSESIKEAVLVLGWNRRGPLVLRDLDRYVAPGSQLVLVAEAALAGDSYPPLLEDVSNLNVIDQAGDITDRHLLETVTSGPVDHVIVLSYSDKEETQEADARALFTLLHLRDIVSHRDRPFSIVSELLDSRNRELADITRADDFIVSDRMLSLMLSQLSENPALYEIFAELFDPDGVEVYLKNAADYVILGRPVSFYTVVASAAARGEVAIGYRQRSITDMVAGASGVHLNPRKSEVLTFQAEDRIIVLAQG